MLDELLRMACSQHGIELEEEDEYGGNDPATAGPTREEMEAMGWDEENGRWRDRRGGEGVAASAPDVLAPLSLADFKDFRRPTNVSSRIAHFQSDYLRNITEAEAFNMLVDTFLLYTSDEWLRGNAWVGYVDKDPLPFFKGFLDRAEAKEGIMPSWWNTEKRKELESATDMIARLIARSSETERHERYGDPDIRMKLRVLAEKIGLDELVEHLTKGMEPPYIPTPADFMRGDPISSSDVHEASTNSTHPQPSTTASASDLIAALSDDYLHNIPETRAYDMLIDVFKLRMGDDPALYREIQIANDPQPFFRRFLRKAEATPRILPSWWNVEKRKKCQRMNMRTVRVVLTTIEAAIQEFYGDAAMPMKLRVLAEKVFADGI